MHQHVMRIKHRFVTNVAFEGIMHRRVMSPDKIESIIIFSNENENVWR